MTVDTAIHSTTYIAHDMSMTVQPVAQAYSTAIQGTSHPTPTIPTGYTYNGRMVVPIANDRGGCLYFEILCSKVL